MKIEMTILRSKLGRRMLQLFVLCALVPVGLLAGISLWRVGHQLEEQSREQLRQTSHEAGLTICERLSFLEADLKLIAARVEAGAAMPPAAAGSSPSIERRFLGVEIMGGDGVPKTLSGNAPWSFVLTAEERTHVHSGRGTVTTRSCGEPRPCIFIAVEAGGSQADQRFVIGRISPSYLLDTEDLPEGKNVCVLDQWGQMLTCSGQIPSALPSGVSTANSGQFQWVRDGEPYEADYWNLFLKPSFFVDHWTVIASERQEERLLPMAQFKRIFGLVVLLTLLAVVLLTLIQIRRQMVPLGKLQEGTRRIASGAFDSRVSIQSSDEFEELASSFNSMAARIEKQFNTLKTNNVIDRVILSAWDFEEIVATLLAHIRSVLPYEAVCVSLLEQDGALRARNYVGSIGSENFPERTASTLGEESLRELSIYPKITTLTVTGKGPEFLAPLLSLGMRFFLVAPIIVRGKLSAVVSLGHREALIWTEDDCGQAQQIADRVGVALSNARLVEDLKILHLGTLTALARAIDAKSHWTSGHSERVTDLALRIAAEMKLPAQDMDILRRGGLLHDIGKIGISPETLDKPGKLTGDELAHIQEHVLIGKRILEPIPGFADCMPVVVQHHERFDGTGYPSGLSREQISIHARILAVADCFDAVVSDRPYRAGMPFPRAIEIVKEGAGTQFDPEVVESFLRVVSADRQPAANEDVLSLPGLAR